MSTVGEGDWEHPIKFISTPIDNSGELAWKHGLRVATLNCLASSYANPSQLHWLSREFLSWEKRKLSILAVLDSLQCDIICFQECDHYNDGFKEDLEKLGYSSTVALRPCRLDGCVTAFHPQKVKLMSSSVVDFNALVDCHGGDQRFKKDNIALLATFECQQTGLPLVVANAHLYWNPLRAEVKLMQAEMLARSCEEVCSLLSRSPACFVCGDLNSMPHSDVINYFEAGEVLAPSPPCDRFLCDTDLNRLCRWLRILGLDAAMESPEERVQRTEHRNFSLLFERSRVEKRLLLTCSKRVVERAECPPYMEISNQNLRQGIVELFRRHPIPIDPQKFLTVCVKCNGSILEEKDWGRDEVASLAALKESSLPSEAVPDHLPLFMCSSPRCRQVYWMSPSDSSSSMRSKAQAAELFELIHQSREGSGRNGGGAGAAGDPSRTDVGEEEEEAEEERATSDLGVASSFYRCKSLWKSATRTPDTTTPQSLPSSRLQHQQPTFLRHSLDLCSPFTASFEHDEDRPATARSASARTDTPISTLRNSFHGLIDHIFFSRSHFRCIRHLELPTAEGMWASTIGPSGSLPSKSWGSDHTVVACDLVWRS